MIVDRCADVAAYVTAPENIREGDATPIALTVTLPNVATARTDVTLSFAPDQSTARNGEKRKLSISPAATRSHNLRLATTLSLLPPGR